jgi:hypothetical protein
MPIYGYIDESGTLIEHQVMTVSLVLIDGRKTADKIGERILGELHPHLASNKRELNKKNLHFADMQEGAQVTVANHLAQEKICGVVSSHFHIAESERHEDLFSRYTRMLQLVLYKGLELTSGPFELVIAEQGSPETYKTRLFGDLDDTVFLFRSRSGQYRDVNYHLKSARTMRGLQLADFYAGTVRKMWIEGLNGQEARMSAPYSQLTHQLTLEDYCEPEKTKGEVAPAFQ